jgi:hypothetical protein
VEKREFLSGFHSKERSPEDSKNIEKGLGIIHGK